MLNLQRMTLFAAVVESGSFTAAAQNLGLTKAVVSFNVRQLEKELGVTLLIRSTRQLTLTEPGQLFYQRGVALLKEAECLQDDVRANHTGLSGSLRITTTPEFGVQVVIPLLAEFCQLHPGLRVRHASSSRQEDLISERFDVAIRLGTLADSLYHAALISRFAILPVASPGWQERHRVDSLAALASAPWIIHERLPAPLRWEVIKREGQRETLEISSTPQIVADSAQALMAFARAGSGVALLPEWLVREAIAQGELVHLLPDHRFIRQGVYAIYPDAQHVPARVRTFIDFLRQRMS